MDYEKEYKELLSVAKELYPRMSKYQKEKFAGVCPELKESEDERIKKDISKLIKYFYGSSLNCQHSVTEEDMLAWLDKKCGNKFAGETMEEKDKIDDAFTKMMKEQKHQFNVGDIIKYNGIQYKITGIDSVGYNVESLSYDEDAATLIGFNTPVEYVDPKHIEYPDGKDYGIDGLWTALDILTKTFGKVQGYQTDDGMLEHGCAIGAVKRMLQRLVDGEDKKN